ncbi:OCIA domain-containing protein 1 isoform X5 [Anolis carolinensis]|uniref:OCIA domain-containing protein 1 isoform X5 n=1 Tax=Anolis carolinensis TaxID=28377 RepID=UPI002F2B7DE0
MEPSRQSQINMTYIPTEDEKRVFRECNEESFWYRFAGFCGYIGGKVSYMKTCQEKFKKLENSPLGEALRKHRPMPHEYQSKQPGFSNASPPFESAPAAESQTSSKYPVDNYGMIDFRSKYEPAPFSSSMSESSPSGITDSSPQEPIPSQEEGPKRRGFTYDELRNRNREMYEAGITQRSEVPSKSSQEIPLKKEGKVNKYGDSWEE